MFIMEKYKGVATYMQIIKLCQIGKHFILHLYICMMKFGKQDKVSVTTANKLNTMKYLRGYTPAAG